MDSGQGQASGFALSRLLLSLGSVKRSVDWMGVVPTSWKVPYCGSEGTVCGGGEEIILEGKRPFATF